MTQIKLGLIPKKISQATISKYLCNASVVLKWQKVTINNSFILIEGLQIQLLDGHYFLN